ncbi:MAG: hypothetical protein KGL18_08400 [Burkholderiales bacterium]|nr:hypothetical protein [Burkholderiales bacterium]MDE1925901.1 hypothetical protein [Burkholderiales bacterium]MDE2502979.1 hypothetical protein [Burkholderiales bacterium]
MTLQQTLAALRRPPPATIARKDLTFVRLQLPALSRGKLLDAVRLQLTQYLPLGPFAYACRPQSAGAVAAWAWPIAARSTGAGRGPSWPEPLLDASGAGLRLISRDPGCEAQHWLEGELRHSRWFATAPSASAWQAFARGCGLDPAAHPLPAVQAAPALKQPEADWLYGDSLPARDPWQGWRWQAVALGLGAVASAGLGAQLQALDQVSRDTLRVAELRKERESALAARAQYEQAEQQLDALQALVPRVSQLELLARVTRSGVFDAPKPTTPVAPAAAASTTPMPGLPVGGAAPVPKAAQLLEWDYRNDSLKITLSLPNRDVTLLGITRRLEAVPELGALKVGQDSGGDTLTVTATLHRPAAQEGR